MTADMRASVSIITPCFNAMRDIERCVAGTARELSALADAEHLVVDGGSTDGTAERLAALAREHAHLRFVSEPDRGQSDALNKGLRLARGTWLGILNADDFYEPGTLSRVARLMQSTAADLLVGNCRVLGENDQTQFLARPRNVAFRMLLTRPSDGEAFPINPSSYFYRRSLHGEAGEYDVDDHYTMDLDFLLAAMKKARIAWHDEVWGNFRLIPGCKTFDDMALGNTPARVAAVCAKHRAKLNTLENLALRHPVLWSLYQRAENTFRRIPR